MEYVGREEPPVDRDWVEDLLKERFIARRALEFEWADEVLRELEDYGIIVMDRTMGRDGTTEGVEWVVRRRSGQHRGLVMTGPGRRKGKGL